MKVLLLTHSFTPEVSPPQRRWSVFAAQFAFEGHEIAVVTPRPYGADNLPVPVDGCARGVVVRRYRSIRKTRTVLGKIFKHGIDALLSFPSALRVSRPDVVIATVPALPTLVVGFLISRIRRVPFVVDLRDAWPDLLRESQVVPMKWLEPILSNFLAYLVRRSDLLVTVTEGLATKMRMAGVTNAKAISNGVEVEKLGMVVPYSPRGVKLRVLYLGNIGRSQGLDLVIQAMADVGGRAELRIVGQGTERKHLISFAKSLGVDVDFRPPVYGQAVLDNYAWADTCLISLRPDWPSFEHTVPSKLYELLFLDRHITGLVRGEAASIIRTSGAGEIVDQTTTALTEHLIRLSDSRALLRTGTRGSAWVRRHASLSVLGREYVSLVSDLVENSKSK